MRFDTLGPPSGGGTTIANGSVTRLRMCFTRWSYFATALVGYAVGLIIASIVVDITGAAQPALLYLVPSTLLPLLIKATVQVCVCVCVSCTAEHLNFLTIGLWRTRDLPLISLPTFLKALVTISVVCVYVQGDIRTMWNGPHFITGQPQPYHQVLPF